MIPIALVATTLIFGLVIVVTFVLLSKMQKGNSYSPSSQSTSNDNSGSNPQREELLNNNNTSNAHSHSHSHNHNQSHSHSNNQSNVSSEQQQQRPHNSHQQSNIVDIDPNRKLTKKEQQKMIKKQAKAEEREAQKQWLEAKKLREQQKERELQLKEAAKEEEKKKLEEELQRIKEEQEKKENEIYNQWKDMIKVGEEGEEGDDRPDFTKEEEVDKFLNYIKIRKVVSLEDLSGEFKLSPNELVDWLNEFEKQGKILGIIDDRGKYIYITEREMAMIEKMFMMRGRISKNELIKECNRIIKFEPTEEDKIKIAEEQKKMLAKLESEIGGEDKK